MHLPMCVRAFLGGISVAGWGEAVTKLSTSASLAEVPERKHGDPKVRFRKGRWSGYFWAEGKCHERTLKATDEIGAHREIRSLKTVIVYGLAPEDGRGELSALVPLQPPDFGGVYAILDERGFVKIGKAQNIRKRLNQLQGANPRPLTLLAVFATKQSIEDRIHRKLKRAGWVRGEWFAPTPAVIAEIRAARGRF
jgi:hypothetical protein